MKKKVGVLNFQYSDHNYGAVLQAVALEGILHKVCEDVEHINFIPDAKKNRTFRERIIVTLEFLRLKKILLKILKKKIIIKKKVQGSEVFELFREKHLTRSKTYNSIYDLKNVASTYDVVIVGSDQVWRPRMYSDLSQVQVYFLSFVSEQTKKISYAASFGVDQWEYKKKDNVTHLVYEYLHKFDSVSVREDTGVAICKNLFKVDATHVLDPTLLIGRSFFDNIIGDLQTRDTGLISYYKLDLNETFLSGVEHVSQMMKCKPCNIYYKSMSGKNYEYYPVVDWLKKIRDSSLIITDSFHCVCFSILFSKNFYCCLNEERGASRLESLLSDLELKDRLISEEDLGKLKSFEDIDYSRVEGILSKKRESSMDFLIKALEG
ncbi:polysaccharide pyruvyl transferase family protein [Xenorhabdus sp. TH1]|uniref:polysaccharide pyruvyl transferase family protein n=1 Tax=Xenorhabdus sp. TH1 TaxID=3130166 RepID=UPI0030D12C12